MIKNNIKTVFLLAGLSGILLWVGNMLGGPQGLVIALIFALIFNIGSYWFSDKIVLRMYNATPIDKHQDKHIYNIVRELAINTAIPMPKIYRIHAPHANAFATGRNPKHAAVAITEGIERLLTERELRGVLAHELSHIKNRDTLIVTIAATMAAVISYVAIMARWAAIFGGSRDNDNSMFEFLALAILTPIMATIIQLAISRSREYLADERAAKISGDPKALASALRKLHEGSHHHPFRAGSQSTASLFIVNPFRSGTLMRLLSTHPPAAKRIEKLENM
ncbi:MAG: zinc metalloprotease HtpX [Candidatus Nanoarchaeia archaeon]